MSMTPEMWQRISSTLEKMTNLDDRAQANYLQSIRRTDPDLAHHLESLLRERERSGSKLPLNELPEKFKQHLEQDSITTEFHVPAEVGEVVSVLGQGGMGIVYLVRQKSLNRLVAVKTLLCPQGNVSQDMRHRFRQEAQTLAALKHPNIVTIHGYGEGQAGPYLIMEYLEKGALADRMKGMPLPISEVGQILEPIASAVHFAHQNGVIHRDLKPSNILQDSHGRLKISDFGVAKILDLSGVTVSGMVVGSWSYMAPEQAAGRSHEVQPSADVYSLGVILFELLTGTTPHKLGERPELALKARRPDIPTELEVACLKCLEPNPSQRGTAEELFKVARSLGGQENSLSATATTVVDEPKTLKSRKHRNGIFRVLCFSSAGLLALLLMGLALQMAISLFQRDDNQPPISKANVFDNDSSTSPKLLTISISRLEANGIKPPKGMSSLKYHIEEIGDTPLDPVEREDLVTLRKKHGYIKNEFLDGPHKIMFLAKEFDEQHLPDEISLKQPLEARLVAIAVEMRDPDGLILAERDDFESPGIVRLSIKRSPQHAVRLLVFAYPFSVTANDILNKSNPDDLFLITVR